jgi:hypothetical protein
MKTAVYCLDFMQDSPVTDSLSKGGHMKKIVILLAAMTFAVSPAIGASKKKSQEAKEADEIAKQHDNTLRALILPSWSLPIYFGTHMDETGKKPEKTAKKKKI